MIGGKGKGQGNGSKRKGNGKGNRIGRGKDDMLRQMKSERRGGKGKATKKMIQGRCKGQGNSAKSANPTKR